MGSNRLTETVCRRLDSLVVEFFSKLSELDGKKAELEAAMADGFIQLSKTRYDLGSGLGNRSIGSAMYDRANMRASVNVVETKTFEGEASGKSNVALKLVSAAEFDASEVADAETRSRPSESEIVKAGNGDDGVNATKMNEYSNDGLRQRKGKDRSAEKDDSSIENYSSSLSSSTKPDDAIENLGKAVGDLKVSPDGMIEMETLRWVDTATVY